MTEQEWLTSVDPTTMLSFLTRRNAAPVRHRVVPPDGLVTDRKLRLFCIACCERYGVERDLDPERDRIGNDQQWAAAWASSGVLQSDGMVYNYKTQESDPDVRAHFLRDIFGNPFASARVWCDPGPPNTGAIVAGRAIRYLLNDILRWNGGTVRRIAEGIYEERAFDRLPILADALQDAGCEDEALIRHCRGLVKITVGVHVTISRLSAPMDPRDGWGVCRATLNWFRKPDFTHRRRAKCREWAEHNLGVREWKESEQQHGGCWGSGRAEERIVNSNAPHVRGCWAIDLLTGRE